MIKFFVLLLLSFLITSALDVLFSKEHSGMEKKEEVVKSATYKVTAEQGIVGCLSEQEFKEVQNFYLQKNFAMIKEKLANNSCFFFLKDEQLSAPQNTCPESSEPNDIFAFKTKKILLGKVFLPCFAVR